MDCNLNSIRYAIPNAEDLCQCPYDDTHMIRAKRMPYHLVKCRLRFKGLNFVNCPFNARHEMPAPELRHHIMNCPDRIMVTQDITASKSVYKGNLKIPMSNWEPIETKEDWEKDAPRYPSFGLDKSTWMQKKTMAKSTIGMTRAEKKKFYEILRINYHREQEGLEPLEMDLVEDEQDSQLQDLLQKQIMSLRKPLNKPQVLIAAEQRYKKQLPEPTPIYNQSLLLAGIGRGKAVVHPDANLPKPGSVWNQSATRMYSSASTHSDTTSDAGTSDLVASSVEPPLRGIGRGMLGVGRGMSLLGILSPGHIRTDSDVSSTTMKDTDAAVTDIEITESESGVKNNKDDSKTADEDVKNSGDVNESSHGNSSHGNGSHGDGVTNEEEDGEKSEDEDQKNYDGSSSNAEEVTKLIKKFEKKLRGIEVLEEKAKEGVKLNSDEMEKISKKDEIITYLEKLGVQH